MASVSTKQPRGPLDTLLDQVDWRCTKCGAKAGACDCWEQVTLRCPVCRKSKLTEKHDTDPVGTATVEFPCEACNRGKNTAPKYFTATGDELHLS